MAITKRPNSQLWNKLALELSDEERMQYITDCVLMDETYRATHPEKSENQKYIWVSAKAREMVEIILAKKMLKEMDKLPSAEDLQEAFMEKYNTKTAPITTFRKALKEATETTEEKPVEDGGLVVSEDKPKKNSRKKGEAK